MKTTVRLSLSKTLFNKIFSYKVSKIIVIFYILAVLFSCTATKTALFDHYSYVKTTEIKVETSKLMDKATLPYVDHEIAVEQLLLDIDKLVEYEKNKPNNEISFAMWTILNDSNKNLLAGFFQRWSQKQTLSAAFTNEAKSQIMEAIDLLIRYEIKKDKQSENLLLDLIKTK